MSIAALIPLLGEVLDRVIPDKGKAAEAKLHLIELEQNGELKKLEVSRDLALAQADVAKTEAAHSNIFVSGARPFILWVGGCAMAWQYMLYPMIQTYLLYTGSTVVMPAVNNDVLFELVALLLGLGGMRSWEKKQGLTK